MAKLGDYRNAEVTACHSVLVEVITVLGGFRDSVVIVGGNVPRLLIPDARVRHPGTLDIDLALDARRIPRQTYRTILQTLMQAGYQVESSQPYVLRRDVTDETSRRTISVQVDLLAGEYGGTGKSHRTQRVQDAHPRKARGCDLAFDNPILVTIEGELPDGGRNKVQVKVAAIGPFLVMKGMALWDRKNEKDAFDIYYCCRHYPGGLPALAKDVRPMLNSSVGREGLEKIRAKFETIDMIGPVWVMQFSEQDDPEARQALQREAFELINALLDQLGVGLFTAK